MRIISLLFVFFLSFSASAQNLIDVYCSEDSCSHTVIDPEIIMIERWDTLAQSKFWKLVMNMSSDTCIVNVAHNRKILGYVEKEAWFCQTEDEKTEYKDSVINYNCLDSNTRIYITSGKKDFYLIEEVIPSISMAIDIFDENHVDPGMLSPYYLLKALQKLDIQMRELMDHFS